MKLSFSVEVVKWFFGFFVPSLYLLRTLTSRRFYRLLCRAQDFFGIAVELGDPHGVVA